jgi:methionyl-tRNA formyltransferase
MSYFAITSNHPRHVKFLEMLYEKSDIDLVVIVSKQGSNISEQEYFNSDMSLLKRKNVLMCTKEQLNSRFVRQTLFKVRADVGFVFGAPLLKEEVFSIPKYGCVNIHTGLVDHYRGVDSSLWALHDNRPDLVGTTLHYIDKSIDTGRVIDMRTVNISDDDNLETLFYKSCQVGFDLLFKNFDDIVQDKVRRVATNSKGRLYQSKDKTDNIIKIAERNLGRYKNENYFRSM